MIVLIETEDRPTYGSKPGDIIDVREDDAPIGKSEKRLLQVKVTDEDAKTILSEERDKLGIRYENSKFATKKLVVVADITGMQPYQYFKSLDAEATKIIEDAKKASKRIRERIIDMAHPRDRAMFKKLGLNKDAVQKAMV